MPLSSYNEVKAYAGMVAFVTSNRLMPPWRADAGFSKIKNLHTLEADEIKLIDEWVKTGMHEGKTLGNVSSVMADSTNVIFETDQVFAMKQAFPLRSDYQETQQVFVIPTNNGEKKFISAIEFIPGNERVVKSCNISIDNSRTATKFDSNDEKYGYYSPSSVGFVPYQFNFFQWIPGSPRGWQKLPGNVELPPKSDIVMAINYTAVAEDVQDSSFIKIHYAGAETDTLVMHSKVLFDTTHIVNGPFKIAAGEKRKFLTERKTNTDITIYGLMPLGQFSLSGWEIYAIDSNSKQRHNLLKIPFWDAHWKRKYELEEPLRLPAGSIIYGIAYYNNGDDNPNLILLPPKKISYGEGHRDELFMVLFDYTCQ